MAIQISFRNGTAAQWASSNPILAQGEMGVTNDTEQFRIGDGITAWNSLPNFGSAGPIQTTPYRSLGDGSDGNVNISSGTTILSRDMFYNNLTINGTGQIFVNNFKIFVKGILDLSKAPTGAINSNSTNGGDASGSVGGTPTSVIASGTLGASGQGTSGATGTPGAGTLAPGQLVIFGNGGAGSNGSAGGNGTNAGAGARSTSGTTAGDFRTYGTNFLRGIALVGGGQGGSGGSSGGGDNTNSGGGGGAGGNGGGVVAIYANIILKSNSTSPGVFQATGGNGGNGGNVASGISGGGGGGAGGAGGWVYLVYNALVGPTINYALQAGGGMGGSGGSGFGIGATGGSGGPGGFGGRIFVLQIGTNSGVEYQSTSSTLFNPEVSRSNPPNGLIGGAGSPGDTLTGRRAL